MKLCDKCGKESKPFDLSPWYRGSWCRSCRQKDLQKQDEIFRKEIASRGGYFKHPEKFTFCRNPFTGSLFTFSNDDDNVSGKVMDQAITYQEEYDMSSSAWLRKYGCN